jgi:hypothetical protein
MRSATRLFRARLQNNLFLMTSTSGSARLIDGNAVAKYGSISHAWA